MSPQDKNKTLLDTNTMTIDTDTMCIDTNRMAMDTNTTPMASCLCQGESILEHLAACSVLSKRKVKMPLIFICWGLFIQIWCIFHQRIPIRGVYLFKWWSYHWEGLSSTPDWWGWDGVYQYQCSGGVSIWWVCYQQEYLVSFLTHVF